jgi:hypothetical protein
MSSLQNLKTPDNYQPAPSVSIQKGGRRHRHKKGGNQDYDIEMGLDESDKLNTNNIVLSDAFADNAEYDLLDAAERGEAGPGIKAGGSRKRRHNKKTHKTRRGRKTHRHSKKGARNSRKSRKHRRK